MNACNSFEIFTTNVSVLFSAIKSWIWTAVIEMNELQNKMHSVSASKSN